MKAITTETVLFWFRRDLRLEDNAGLYYALKNHHRVLPIFIFDTNILGQLDDRQDRRVEFIQNCIAQLKQQLESLGSTLAIFHGQPEEIFKHLSPKGVYANHDFEPYARQRDENIGKILAKKNAFLKTYKDHVVFEKDEVVKDDGTPYTIFTPYSRKWKSLLDNFYLKAYPTKKYFSRLQQHSPLPMPMLEDLGFERTKATFPQRVIKVSIIEQYDKTRDYPAIHGTTRLSVHLRFGTVSIRKLAHLATKKNETWLNELIWRDFYAMILWHFPHVQKHSFKPDYDRIAWRNNEEEFQKWCDGKTGYPIVDAGMRELNATGFMHNRVRMITASFLTKHLLIDWRWGEAYFGKKLLDYELASNNGGWQWAASSGCDAVPYFRIFNPQLQTEKFDRELKYVRLWVPEVDTADYPKPIVDHQKARDRALKTYKKALSAE